MFSLFAERWYWLGFRLDGLGLLEIGDKFKIKLFCGILCLEQAFSEFKQETELFVTVYRCEGNANVGYRVSSCRDSNEPTQQILVDWVDLVLYIHIFIFLLLHNKYLY